MFLIKIELILLKMDPLIYKINYKFKTKLSYEFVDVTKYEVKINKSDKVYKVDKVEEKEDFNFWNIITELNWNNGHGGRASTTWSKNKVEFMIKECREKSTRLFQSIPPHFWNSNKLSEEAIHDLLAHIVSCGEDTYEGVLEDYTFLTAFLDQPCGFRQFLLS